MLVSKHKVPTKNVQNFLKIHATPVYYEYLLSLFFLKKMKLYSVVILSELFTYDLLSLCMPMYLKMTISAFYELVLFLNSKISNFTYKQAEGIIKNVV